VKQRAQDARAIEKACDGTSIYAYLTANFDLPTKRGRLIRR
jgi:hypothetical protein